MAGEGRDGMEELIPENSTLARRIRAAASKGTLSHAAILSGSGDRMAAARYFAAALECEGEGERPCLRCRQCRKVLEDIHPDVVTVRDDGHKELPVELVRQLRQDVYIRPNDGARKVYIFADCGQLNQRDQNVLLKIVEEGPAYAAFLFCAEKAAALLPTIRSRCVEWNSRRHRRWSRPEGCAGCWRRERPSRRPSGWYRWRTAASSGSSCRSFCRMRGS